MTIKLKDRKVGSPEWFTAWQRILENDFIMRCMLETSLHELRFWMEIFLMSESGVIYQIRMERFLGETIKLPRVTLRGFDVSLENLIRDLQHFWFDDRMSNYLTIPKLELAVPHRGFIRQYGSADVVLLSTNNALLMDGYGAVREWLYQAKRGRVKSDTDSGVSTENEKILWKLLEQRFRAFLYRQKVSLIKETLGVAVEAIHG